jgi:hypothetical protein
MSYKSWKMTMDQQYLLDQGVNAARPFLAVVALMEDQAKQTIFGHLEELIENREFKSDELGPIVDLAYEKALEVARALVEKIEDETGEEEGRLEMERDEAAATKRKK